MTFIVSIVMKESLLLQIDKIRGDVPRSKCISRLLERMLKEEGSKGSVSENDNEVMYQNE